MKIHQARRFGSSSAARKASLPRVKARMPQLAGMRPDFGDLKLQSAETVSAIQHLVDAGRFQDAVTENKAVSGQWNRSSNSRYIAMKMFEAGTPKYEIIDAYVDALISAWKITVQAAIPHSIKNMTREMDAVGLTDIEISGVYKKAFERLLVESETRVKYYAVLSVSEELSVSEFDTIRQETIFGFVSQDLTAAANSIDDGRDRALAYLAIAKAADKLGTIKDIIIASLQRSIGAAKLADESEREKTLNRITMDIVSFKVLEQAEKNTLYQAAGV